MPASTDYQHASSASSASSLAVSIRPMPSCLEGELENFQRHVTERFVDLASVSSDQLLSLSWIRKLLDSFLCLQEEFRVILFNHKSVACKTPSDRLIHEFLERSVKALDVCNAIRDGIEQIREWKKLLDIVPCALDGCSGIGEGHFRRAKKALIDLSISMLDDKDSTAAALAQRNRSFGRHHHHSKASLGHFRSLSWSVSRSWSAARQLQAIGSSLVAPRGNDVVASNGIAVAVFTMSSVLLFVTWALVAAIPCQDRGLQVHFSIPRHFPWAQPVLSLHERVVEESRRRDRRNSCGLLRELYQMDKCVRVMLELGDSLQFPLTQEREGEVRQRVHELAQLCEAIKEGLEPLERQVREVFHRIVRSRTESLDSLGRVRPNHND